MSVNTYNGTSLKRIAGNVQSASDLVYDNAESQLATSNTQGALDILAERQSNIIGSDAYHDGTAYNCGDMCIYQNALYRAKVTTRAVPTTASDWEEISLEDVSNSTVYASTETVIGTWENGKPIYRKVVDTTFPATNNVAIYDMTDTNVDELITLKGNFGLANFTHGTKQYCLPFFGGTTFFIAIFWQADAQNAIKLYASDNFINSNTAGKPLSLILEYTKP